MFLLKQEDIQKMAYQTYGGVNYIYGDEEKLRKKFNRKIIRNYILCALLGATITTQVFLAVKNPSIIKKVLLADVLVLFVASGTTTTLAIKKELNEEKAWKKDVESTRLSIIQELKEEEHKQKIGR